jgi:hypothetical protein
MANVVSFALAIGALSLAGHVTAQAAEPCELHVYPAYAVGVVDATQVNVQQGALGSVVAAGIQNLFRIKDPQAVQLFLQDALPPADQMAMLRAIRFAETVKGNGRTVIIHETPVTNLTLKGFKTQPRSAQTPAACYSELVLAGIYFEKSTLSQKLKSSYFWRDFGTASVPQRAFLKGVGEGLSNFPPKTEQEAAQARESVRAIARRNLLAIMNAK